MLQEAETRVKRVILLILALLLLSDLAEDCCLGKATVVPPHSSAKTSLSSPLRNCSGKVDSHHTLSSDGGEISRLLQFKPVMLLAYSSLKIIIHNHTGSSGGVPL